MTESHRHAKGLQAIGIRLVRHAVRRRRRTIRKSVEGCGGVTMFRTRGSLLERAQVVLARVLFFVFAGQVERSVATILTTVGTLVSRTDKLVDVTLWCRCLGLVVRGCCSAVRRCGMVGIMV